MAAKRDRSGPPTWPGRRSDNEGDLSSQPAAAQERATSSSDGSGPKFADNNFDAQTAAQPVETLDEQRARVRQARGH